MKKKAGKKSGADAAAVLMLEDGTFFQGKSAGYAGEAAGFITFDTSVGGYQELLTDPAVKGHIICMTWPEQGNTGINSGDYESSAVHAAGFVAAQISRYTSNWRAEGDFRSWLIKNKITAIDGLDVRAIVRHIIKKGEMGAVISAVDFDKTSLLKKARATAGIKIAPVSTDKEYKWDSRKKITGLDLFDKETVYLKISDNKRKFKVAAFDFGIRQSALKMFASAGCEVIVLPASTKARRVEEIKADGVFLSGGPGDPREMKEIQAEIKQLLGKVPVLGTGLGCQLMAAAAGIKIDRMKAGHRGGNHSIINTRTKGVEVASQYHGFSINAESIKKSNSGFEPLLINLNDGDIEGIDSKKLKAFGVQYYPQARPGKHDAPFVFNKFIDYMKSAKGVK